MEEPSITGALCYDIRPLSAPRQISTRSQLGPQEGVDDPGQVAPLNAFAALPVYRGPRVCTTRRARLRQALLQHDA